MVLSLHNYECLFQPVFISRVKFAASTCRVIGIRLLLYLNARELMSVVKNTLTNYKVCFETNKDHNTAFFGLLRNLFSERNCEKIFFYRINFSRVMIYILLMNRFSNETHYHIHHASLYLYYLAQDGHRLPVRGLPCDVFLLRKALGQFET